jgi:hypothetical protein
MYVYCLSQCPRGLRRRSAAARLLRSWVRIPTGAWMFICCECCVLSGRGLCDLITRPEESYRLWCVDVCDLETSRMRRPWPALGRSATENKNVRVLLISSLIMRVYKRVYQYWYLNQPSFRIVTIIFKLWVSYSVIHCLWKRERRITPSGYCSPCKPLHLTGPVQSGMLVLHRPLTLILPLPVRMGVVHKRV